MRVFEQPVWFGVRLRLGDSPDSWVSFSGSTLPQTDLPSLARQLEFQIGKAVEEWDREQTERREIET